MVCRIIIDISVGDDAACHHKNDYLINCHNNRKANCYDLNLKKKNDKGKSTAKLILNNK